MDGRPRYSVQILLSHHIEIGALDLTDRLRAWRADIDQLGDRALYAIPTNDLPLLVHIFVAELDTYAGSLCDALTWSPRWHWSELADRCKSSLVITVMGQRPINHASLLLTFLAVLDAVLFALPPALRDGCVLHWIPSQQLLTFDHYRLLRTELGPCGPAINVRVTNASGRPGELWADTIGLAELGLPDLQVPFSGSDTTAVIARLRELARSMFVGDRLECNWIEESARLPPQRDALTLQLE